MQLFPPQTYMHEMLRQVKGRRENQHWKNYQGFTHHDHKTSTYIKSLMRVPNIKVNQLLVNTQKHFNSLFRSFRTANLDKAVHIAVGRLIFRLCIHLNCVIGACVVNHTYFLITECLTVPWIAPLHIKTAALLHRCNNIVPVGGSRYESRSV